MKRHFDEVGRIVIPKEMREKLDFGIHDYAEIKLNDNEIILSNPKYKDQQEQLNFLMERENKLQNLEYVLKNVKTVTVSDIKKILNL